MSPLALSVRFLQTQPDRRLIELARAGHERAFEALVQRYRRSLLRYCRRLSPSEASAEDVLQQGLMQAWVALGNPEVEVRDARAWLYRIVHNVAISQLRLPVHDSLDVEDGGQTGDAGDEVERRLEVRAALAGLASLPELQRQVMLSTALEGRSHDEVADALGLSHGAVRGLIYRARATLRAAAAAITPSPLIQWAVRQGGGSGRSAALVEVVAGGGSVGIGSLIVKGGAVVAAAGAIATAAGIAGHAGGHQPRHRRDASGARAGVGAREAGAGAAVRNAATIAASGAASGSAAAAGSPGTGSVTATPVALRSGGSRSGRGSGSGGPGAGRGPAGGAGSRRGRGPGGQRRLGGSGGSGGSGAQAVPGAPGVPAAAARGRAMAMAAVPVLGLSPAPDRVRARGLLRAPVEPLDLAGRAAPTAQDLASTTDLARPARARVPSPALGLAVAARTAAARVRSAAGRRARRQYDDEHAALGLGCVRVRRRLRRRQSLRVWFRVRWFRVRWRPGSGAGGAGSDVARS